MILLVFLINFAYGYDLALPHNGKVAGALQVVAAGPNDNLLTLAKRLDVAPNLLARANPNINFDDLRADELIFNPTYTILPTSTRSGIVVNIAENRLYDFTTKGRVFIYSVGTGRKDWSTPLGDFKITGKRHLPVWNVPKSVHEEELDNGVKLPKRVPPGPDNPLGEHSMRLSHTSYLIHGTNDITGIGIRSTSGCVSMYPSDIEALFQRTPIGTNVKIVDVPVKISKNSIGYLIESHFETKNNDIHFTKQKIDDTISRLVKAYKFNERQISQIRQIIEENTGIPHIVR
tara:strand:+ start:747 stop:1613 length:867 start_codon:yes stop_codon:yes gene_type:complete